MEINSKLIQFFSEGLPCVDGLVKTDINSGGCGVFAQLLTKQLKKVNIEYKIIGLFFPDEPDERIKNAKENIIKLNNNSKITSKDIIPSHIVVSIFNDTLFLDSEGISNKKALFSEDTVEITDECLSTLLRINDWNKEFNKHSIPKIEEGLECIFKDFDTFNPHDFINNLRKGEKMYVSREQ